MLRSGLFLVIALLASGLIGPAPLQAAEPKVNDNAPFFTKAAIDQATSKMQDIRRRYKVEVVVDTLPALPENVKKEYDDEKDKARFFHRWARRRAADAGVKGIYILICKDPPHIIVEPDDAVRAKGFTQTESEQLAKNIAGNFKAKRFDAGLTDAIEFIQTNLQDNLRRSGAATAPPVERSNPGAANSWPVPQQGGGNGAGLGGWICFGVVAILVIWMISALIRAFSRGSGSGYGGMPGGGGPGGMGGYGGGGYGPGYGGGGGGGGFMSSLLGGMFGAAAGNWMYDSMFRGSGQSSSWGGSNAGGQSGFGSTDQGQDALPADQPGAGVYGSDDNAGGDASFGDDSTSSGGGSDDSGGGGDFGGGGGDFGGGSSDFGGGDSGGGGGGDSSW